jgi:hypothetical protein
MNFARGFYFVRLGLIEASKLGDSRARLELCALLIVWNVYGFVLNPLGGITPKNKSVFG